MTALLLLLAAVAPASHTTHYGPGACDVAAWTSPADDGWRATGDAGAVLIGADTEGPMVTAQAAGWRIEGLRFLRASRRGAAILTAGHGKAAVRDCTFSGFASAIQVGSSPRERLNDNLLLDKLVAGDCDRLLRVVNEQAMELTLRNAWCNWDVKEVALVEGGGRLAIEQTLIRPGQTCLRLAPKEAAVGPNNARYRLSDVSVDITASAEPARVLVMESPTCAQVTIERLDVPGQLSNRPGSVTIEARGNTGKGQEWQHCSVLISDARYLPKHSLILGGNCRVTVRDSRLSVENAADLVAPGSKGRLVVRDCYLATDGAPLPNTTKDF